MGSKAVLFSYKYIFPPHETKQRHKYTLFLTCFGLPSELCVCVLFARDKACSKLKQNTTYKH